MKEYSIEIEIDEDGLLEVETFGFKGKVCETELTELLRGEFVIGSTDKKDDYYKSEDVELVDKTKVGGRRL